MDDLDKRIEEMDKRLRRLEMSQGVQNILLIVAAIFIWALVDFVRH